jgi:UDP-N-acetylmuramyl pentapeptide phosphotransferase/UDP-N-acetylglucosamine-1-phosphate transferase
VPPIRHFEDEIVAIPTVDDVVAIASDNLPFIAASPVDDIIASARAFIASQVGVVARPGVDDIVAVSSEDKVASAKAAYLVVAVLTGQFVIFLSVPKSMPPLGQPGTSFVARDWPCSLMIRVRSHRASSGAVASGECSFCNFSSF